MELVCGASGPEPSCKWHLTGVFGVGLFGITVTELHIRFSFCTAVDVGVSTGMDLVFCLVPSTITSDFGVTALLVEDILGMV